MKIINRVLLAVILMLGFPYASAADSNIKTFVQIKLPPEKPCSTISTEESTKLGLIKQLLLEGKPHAAIAYLDASKIKNEQAELFRANGLRQTGRMTQAQVIYQQLVTSCVVGHAYRGLGLIASQAGNLQEALRYMDVASRALPTEHSIHNDLGYILMQSGSYELALHEFLTALELAPEYRQAANNLVVLLYRQGETAKAENFAKKFGIVAEELQQLKRMTQATNNGMP